MDAGIFRGITNDDYHSGPGDSKSGLDLVDKAPIYYRAATTAANDNRPPPTAAQALGTAFHMIVLEPGEFIRQYTLGLRRSDVPEAIDDREVLVAMVQKLNEGRRAKIATSGSKAELIDRIVAENSDWTREALEPMKGAELKSIIDGWNLTRQGLLTTSGSRHDLADLLRANGVAVTLWSDVLAEWMANNGHRTVLSQEAWDQLHNMRDAVMAHPAASKLLSAPGEAELSAYWYEDVTDPVTGEVIGRMLCRCRPDYYRKDGLVADLKSCDDASEEAFARSIGTWRYHVQDPFYQDGLTKALQQSGGFEDFQPPRAFVFIACEKTACVVDGVAKGVAVYRLDEESREMGRHEYRANLRTLARCQNSGEWPGYSDGIRQIKLPAWKFARAAEKTAAST
ncbi:MAG TPA: PD-(D/E)XK nuclease-like domain-containing protein [Pyrinomonadaceae bacterium]|nr:PD-(D/E)XK nuclease-like domain-containing protein [Pyrinomonadaceae bacterium]